ncbi:aminotransferase class III-fold pyridoxal phosphate-dependent enzyme [soil metagenome]
MFFDDTTVAAVVGEHFGFHATVRAHFNSECDQSSLLVDQFGAERIVKISNDATSVDEVDLEGSAALWAHNVDPGLPIAVPLPTRSGALHAQTLRLVRLYNRLPGRASVDGATLSPSAVKEYGATTARLGLALRGFFHPAAARRSPWHVESRHHLGALDDDLVRGAVEGFERNVAPLWGSLRAQPVHSDLTLDNLLLDDHEHVSGIIDFGDLTHTALVADIAAALVSVGSTRTGRDLLSTIARFLDGYTAISPLEPVERAVLADTVRLRCAITVSLSANRPAANDYLRSWDAGAWNMLRELRDVDPAVFGATRPHPRGLRQRRDKVFGTVLAPLTYAEPLTPVKGSGATLLDVDGRTYIDAYNNVPVVGHAHPRVASAIADQARLLSTNLRYLHPRAIELAERLTASMPDPSLDTVLFLNSGSEAVDLAWRIATAVTGNTGALVSDFAYHGVTTATTALSPEQWRGGWVPHHVERFTVGDSLDDAVARLAARGHEPAALFIDPTYTSDGILVPGKQYHQSLTTNAMVIADEVQAGFGRAGDHLWSFVGAGITPDLVTLGKQMGNGYPVAAVIARRADVEALAAQTEFFSTFSGGPVAATAAMAVLDVIDDERLIEHAAAMGELLRSELESEGLDVRGRGLLLGVPLRLEAAEVLDEARRNGVLIGSTGPRNDVLKIRPPLVITPGQVQQVAAVVSAAVKSVVGKREQVRADA